MAKPHDLDGSRAVVVDALRATTTIIAALEAGAVEVLPCRAIDDAQQRAARMNRAEVLLAGERGGRPIEGFDLGNSPAEFTRSRVAGKHLVMTTTNGTLALLGAAAAQEVLVGAFVNLSAVCERLLRSADHAPIVVVCAGTDDEVTREDVLFAGAVVDRLADTGRYAADDSAIVARDAWRAVARQLDGAELERALAVALRECSGGRNLLDIGMSADIDWAAAIDRFARVPVFDAASGKISFDAAAR